MTIVRTTRAAPTGSSTNTLTSASWTAPAGQLIHVFGFQASDSGGPGNQPALTIGNTHGLSFTKIASLETITGAIALWRTIGNGASGTVTVSSTVTGNRVTELRAYSFAGSIAIDTLVGDGDGAVEGAFAITDSGDIDLPSGTFPPTSNSLLMGYIGALEQTEVLLDVRTGWAQVEQWDTATVGTVQGSLQVVDRTGVIDPTDPTFEFQYDVVSGSATALCIGTGIKDATYKASELVMSRGGRIKANYY